MPEPISLGRLREFSLGTEGPMQILETVRTTLGAGS